jgi:hypothetical protein
MHIISKIRYIMTSRLFGEVMLGQTYSNWAVKSPAFLETSTLAMSNARTSIVLTQTMF